MGKIKKLLESELIGGSAQNEEVYPVTSDKAVFDSNNTPLSDVISGIKNNVTNLTDLTYIINTADTTANNNFIKCVKGLYFDKKPDEGFVYIIKYFCKTGSKFQFTVSIYNIEDNSETTMFSLKLCNFGELNTITSDDGTIKCYILAEEADYVGPVKSYGQSLSRFPRVTSKCFDYNSQSTIIGSELEISIASIDNRTTKLENDLSSISNRLDIIGTLGLYESDITKCGYAKSSIKAIYIKDKLDANKRVVISYFAKFQSKYQLGLTIYDSETKEETVLCTTTGLIYNFDEVVELYNDSVEKKVVGYAYASLADYVNSVVNQGEGLNRLPFLLDLAFDLENQPIIHNYLYGDPVNILVWGDSITWGSTASANDKCYTAILRSLIKENNFSDNVVNCGVGGESFQNILVRQGALGFYLADDIILPASPSEKVEIQRTTNYITNKKFKNTWFGEESYFSLLLQGELGRDNIQEQYRTVNPIYVNGIECTMTLEGTLDNNIIYLATNNQLSGPITIKNGTFLYPHGNTFKAKTSVFSIGTNGGFQVKTEEETIDIEASIQQYIQLIDLAIEKSNSSQFIVCTPYGGEALRDLGVEGLKKLEAAVTKRYGNRHFNWRKYLVEYGLSDAGIEPTSEDTEAIGKGEVPPSLLSDGLHPNDAGHKVIGERLYDMMLSLGYLSSK